VTHTWAHRYCPPQASHPTTCPEEVSSQMLSCGQASTHAPHCTQSSGRNRRGPHLVRCNAPVGQASRQCATWHCLHTVACVGRGQFGVIRIADLLLLNSRKCAKEHSNSQARQSVHASLRKVSNRGVISLLFWKWPGSPEGTVLTSRPKMMSSLGHSISTVLFRARAAYSPRTLVRWK
jgi:hypothetical protein